MNKELEEYQNEIIKELQNELNKNSFIKTSIVESGIVKAIQIIKKINREKQKNQ